MKHLISHVVVAVSALSLLALSGCSDDGSDHCGDGLPFDASTQFCWNERTYNKCGGVTYDPNERFCHDNRIYGVCEGNAFDPDSSFCNINGIIYEHCDNFNPLTTMCGSRAPTPICDGEPYPTVSHWCENSEPHPLCRGQRWNIAGRNPCSDEMSEVKIESDGRGATLSNFYSEGDTVNIFAGTPPEGMAFWRWRATSNVTFDGVFRNLSANSSFIMPATAVTIKAEFLPRTTTVEIGSYTDSRDGKVYRTITLNAIDRTWFAENLNYTVSNDSLRNTIRNPVCYAADTADCATYGDIGVCYDDDPANCETYGRLYTWREAMDIDPRYSSGSWIGIGDEFRPQGICPNGWGLPSEDDWKALVIVAGGYSRLVSDDWSGDDFVEDIGFSALPGGVLEGYSTGSGRVMFYEGIGSTGYWWTSTQHDSISARNERISATNFFYSGASRYENGLSVRCITRVGRWGA